MDCQHLHPYLRPPDYLPFSGTPYHVYLVSQSDGDTVNTGRPHLMVTLFLQTGNHGLVIRISAEWEDHPEWTLKDQR
jgi:hypothetical protein